MPNWFFEYPLTQEDLTKLHKGDLVLKNFSPPLQPNILFCIVAWNKGIMKQLDKSLFEAMRKGGINIANIPLEDDNLSCIEQGNFVEVHFFPCKVIVAKAETFTKAKAECKEQTT
jgi:hypothetical protein